MKIQNKSKKVLPPLPQVVELIEKLVATPNDDLVHVLGDISVWKWPRSDLNAWIKVLNKFDAILEEVIRDYEVDKLQVNDFAPLTKRTVCEILRFERMLLENSTNRKTFNSYDRLNSLMLTSDLDVLVLTLTLILRPSQQYSAQPAVAQALNISTHRLQCLTRRWNNIREAGVTLADLVTEKGRAKIDTLPPDARDVHFTFYRKEGTEDKPQEKPVESTADVSPHVSPHATPRKSASGQTQQQPLTRTGAVNISIDRHALQNKTVMSILADAVETHNIPDDAKFELMCRIRVAQAFCHGNDSDREKLVIVRALAIAIFCHTHNETQALSTLFLPEPDLANHLAELLQLDRGIPITVQTAAIAALDGAARYRGKIQEVLAAVNAGVNHGTLMSLLRKTVNDVANPESTIPHSFVEALLALVTFLASHAAGGNMVVAAGLIPLLIQIIDNRLPQRLMMVSKTMQLVDNVLYGFTNAFQLFCNNHGVETLVDRIQHEVDSNIAEFGGDQPAHEIPVSYGKLPVARAAVLKHILRSMHRMMQTSGTSEGLRGLIDSSLLKSVKKIIGCRSLFGPSILPFAINIMATFVHNEPTSLTIIQEIGLPEAFYKVVESGVEPSFEVIQAIPNALGALCLNQTGQDQLAARPSIIPGLLSIFTSERHLRVLQDKENAVLIGTSIDELIRHHPFLKAAVFEAVRSILGQIEDLGKSFIVPEDIRHFYQLIPDPEVPPLAEDETGVAMDVDQSPASVLVTSSEDPNVQGEEPEKEGTLQKSTESHDNQIVAFIDVIGRFLEGLFQHPVHCKDFVVNTDGLERIGRLTGLPCLPYDFANSIASDSLVQVIRTMVEAATNETLAFLVKLVKESLVETEEFWKFGESTSTFLPLLETKDNLEEVNQRWRSVVALNIRVAMLSDLYSTAGYSHSRGSASLLQALIGRGNPDVITGLGDLHRACVWESIVFKNGVGVKDSDPSMPSFLRLPPDGQADDNSLVHSPFGISTAENPTPDANPIERALANSGGNTSPSKTSKEKDSPRTLNIKALSHALNQIPSSLTPLFQSIVKLFFTRRTPDASTKQRILDTSALVAGVVSKHLSPKVYDDDVSLFTYYTVMLGLASILLVDERTTQHTLHTVLLVSLNRIGGIKSIFDISRSFMSSIERALDIKEEDRTEAQKEELVHAYGGLKVALHLIHPLISSKPLFEAGQTSFLNTKERGRNDDFDPHDLLVTLRLAAFPLLRDLWNSSWLVLTPLSVCKSVVQAVLELLNSDGEEPSPSASSSGDMPSARQGPDENRIRQLTDMGFPRASVERALLRAHNNVAAATDLLLSQPFLLMGDPEPAEQNLDTDSHGDQDSDDSEPGPWELAARDAASTSNNTPTVTPEARRKELADVREEFATNMPRQALRLLDDHSSLMFDVHSVFTVSGEGTQEHSINLLIDDITSFSPAAYDVQEQPLAVRCRLLAVIFGEVQPSVVRKTAVEGKKLMDILLALLLSGPSITEEGYTTPSWLAAHLLLTEALLILGEEPRKFSLPKSDENLEPDAVPKEELLAGPPFTDARNILFDFCYRLLSLGSISRDEQLSCLRLLVALTRDHAFATELVKRGGIDLLLKCLRTKADPFTLAGPHSYITTILRHIIEDKGSLEHIMQREIKRFVSHPRTRPVDPSAFVRSCSAMALRDPAVFVDATNRVAQLYNPLTSIQNIAAKKENQEDKTSTQSTEAPKDADMQVDEQLVTSTEFPESLESVVHFLIAELMGMAKQGSDQLIAVSSNPPSSPTDALTTALQAAHTSATPETAGNIPANSSEAVNNYAYTCFLMQALTELLFSYESCKLAFLSYSPKKRSQSSKDTKFRTTALNFFLSDLVSFGALDSQATPEARRRIILCNWAMSVLVALCVDPAGGHDLKDVPADLVSVRKFVIEAVSRSIKDLPLTTSIESRYARLSAITDLCYRLLTVRFGPGIRKTPDEIPTHISKVMLEKNFVASLTAALGDIDLNYPNVRAVVTAVLKPMEYLTKVAIKMSRTSGKTKDLPDENVADSDGDSEVEDAASNEAREETPDLYRNSSLGMFGGEMEDVSFGPDESMDDEIGEDEDAEMDFGEDTGSEDTSRTDDDDDMEEDDDREVDVDDETGESEGAWQDEDGADLVENGEEGEGDDDGDDEDEEADDGVLWPGEGPEQVPGETDEGDDEEGIGGLPVILGEEEEEDEDEEWASPQDGELGVLEAQDTAPGQFPSIFGIGNPFADVDGGRNGPSLVWTSGRRAVDEATDIFGRPPGASSAPEATTHPLLLDTSGIQRAANQHPRVTRRLNRTLISDLQPHNLLATLESLIGGSSTLQILNQLLHQTRPGGPESLPLDVPAGALLHMESHLLAQRGGRGHLSAVRVERARGNDPRREERDFNPLGTTQRWSEEAKILYGKHASDRLSKLADHVVLRMLPDSLHAAKEAKEAREKEAAKLAEAEAEAEAKAQAAKKEEEEATVAPVIETPAPAPEPSAPPQTDTDEEMGDEPTTEPQQTTSETPGVVSEATGEESSISTSAAPPDASTSAPPRVTVMIHGSPVDITDTGIDPTFLEALPDDMREEVINQHVRDQRAARVERPADSQISTEFLEALPADIRAEILQQERLEQAQARRRTDEATNPVAPVAPAELDNADFLASLDPQLREVVLLDQDEGFLRTLPPHILAEAQGYRDGMHRQHRRTMPTVAVRSGPPASRPPPPPRDAIQLIEKNNVATLVRLLFFPQVLKKNTLFKVLLNLCENTKTRTELFNLLLSVLQEGSGDVAAMDKSFAHMSVRNSKSPNAKALGKQRAMSDTFNPLNLPSDIVPELRARRCLEALTFIVDSNESSSLFFLTEHELPAALRKSSKKGKGKERQTHYPIVSLLSLLDRESLLKASSITESIVGLLASVTRPLTSLKEKSDTPVPSTSQPQPPSSQQPTQEPAPPSTSEPAATAAESSEQPKPDATEQDKALLTTPPQVPSPLLRSIVNVLTIGECTGRTFQQTLALIQHVSHIPDAQDTIAQELKLRAQEFGKTLSSDLDELSKALQSSEAESMTGSVTSRFASSSSDQAKLLRILKTIDYMYTAKSPAASTSEGSQQIQKIYETFKFASLWRKLSDCLTLIDKPELDHIAAILLPLIECLMVVCKYVGSKTSLTGRLVRSASLPQSPVLGSSESMEDLFVAFTDNHRKLLNVMVRNNPSLMSGSFSLLVHNPRVLDFDNKRNYFNQQLHRRPHGREHHNTLQLNVRRARVFEDSYQYLQRKTGEQIKYGKLSVRFYDEEGVDAGGVTREWFQILARQMFNPNYALFQPCAADRLTYQPNRASAVNPEHLSFFKFVGRVIGKAIFDGRLLDAYFARSLYRQLLGKPVDYRDVEWVDPEYYKSLCWILENDPSLLDLTFSAEADEFGVTKIVPLKENGDKTSVTLENRKEFVQLSAQYRLYSSIKEQIEALLGGFYEIIPKELISIFNEQEVELLISGTPDIDVDEWRAATEYNGYTSSDPVIVWWWRALKSFNREERAKVLSFATGTSRVPLGGFVDLQGVQGVQRFSIHRAYGDPSRLPQAHTCFNQIDLPQYTSYEMLRQQLLLAINEGGEGFGFA